MSKLLRWELDWIDNNASIYASPLIQQSVKNAIARRYLLNHFSKLIRNPSKRK